MSDWLQKTKTEVSLASKCGQGPRWTITVTCGQVSQSRYAQTYWFSFLFLTNLENGKRRSCNTVNGLGESWTVPFSSEDWRRNGFTGYGAQDPFSNFSIWDKTTAILSHNTCSNFCLWKCMQNYLPYFVKLIRQLICTLVCPHRTKLLL